MTIKLNMSDVPAADALDMSTWDETIAAGRKATGTITRAKNRISLAGYVIGAATYRVGMLTAEGQDMPSQKAIADEFGCSQGYVSKGLSIAKVAACEAGHDLGEEFEQADERRRALLTYWQHEVGEGYEGPSFHDAMTGLIAADGETRRDALVTVHNVFGAPETFYNVMTGKRLHEKDPNNVADDEGEGEGDAPDGEKGPDDVLAALETAWKIAKQCEMDVANFMKLAMQVTGKS